MIKFTLADPKQSYPVRVTVEAPDPESEDAVCECQIRMRLRYLPTDEYLRLAVRGVTELLPEIVASWEADDVLAADKTPLSCTRENIEMLSRISYFAAGVLDAYRERFSPEKNSKPRPPAF